jgi:hypothetical protein
MADYEAESELVRKELLSPSVETIAAVSCIHLKGRPLVFMA